MDAVNQQDFNNKLNELININNDPSVENNYVDNFVSKSEVYYNQNKNLYTVRGFQDTNCNSAMTRAENQMRYLSRAKTLYSTLKAKPETELKEYPKTFMKNFEETMKRMQLEIGPDGNFKNIENCEFVRTE